jgi:hypothetical protein
MRSYDVPHKGLRNALSQLELLSGKTDYSSLAEIEELYNLSRQVFKIIAIHADDESQVTLAELELRCPGSSEHDPKNHEYLEAGQSRIEDLLEKIYLQGIVGQFKQEWGELLYRMIHKYHGTYLIHMSEKESITQPLLWQHFSDEELAGHREAIMQRKPQDVLLTWLRFIIPAQSLGERVGLLCSLKKIVPDAFYEVVDVIRLSLSVEEFSILSEESEANGLFSNEN